MKSIMQEASSVIKAIQQAWETAGQPKEFSVKIFEVEKKNFIGFTTQSAKVGIFFNEQEAFKHERSADQKGKSQHYQQRKQVDQFKRPTHQPHQQPQQFQRREREQQEKPRPVIEQPVAQMPKEAPVVWTQDMIDKASEWTNGALKALNLSQVPFSITTDHYQLNLLFSKPLLDDVEKERNLFRSLSFLMLCSLKRNFKRPMRGFKVIITRS